MSWFIHDNINQDIKHYRMYTCDYEVINKDLSPPAQATADSSMLCFIVLR